MKASRQQTSIVKESVILLLDSVDGKDPTVDEVVNLPI